MTFVYMVIAHPFLNYSTATKRGKAFYMENDKMTSAAWKGDIRTMKSLYQQKPYLIGSSCDDYINPWNPHHSVSFTCEILKYYKTFTHFTLT